MTRFLLLGTSLILLLAPPASGQSGGVFEITRSTIDGGGSTERPGDGFWLRGTIGQPDVGVSSQGPFFLTGAFWATDGETGFLFLDGFETGDTSRWSVTTGQGTAANSVPTQEQTGKTTFLEVDLLKAKSLGAAVPGRDIAPETVGDSESETHPVSASHRAFSDTHDFDIDDLDPVAAKWHTAPTSLRRLHQQADAAGGV